MTPIDLANECKRVIESEYKLRFVTLIVPGAAPRSERIRLDRMSRRKCPMGEVVNWQDNPPRTVAMFDAIEVLAWLHARGLVHVDVRAREEVSRG